LLERFDIRDLTAAPWKNGGGTTREIACRPPRTTVADFAWRASIATIAADGPFSVFAGVDRSITLLQGGGVHLRTTAGGDIDHRLDTPFVPFAFDGARAVNATLLAGESLDFNVMTRRDRVRADVRAVREACVLQPAACGLVYAGAGEWTYQDGPAVTRRLSSGQGLWWDAPRVHCVSVVPATPAAVLLAVAIIPVDRSPDPGRIQ
jgi:environmental stress-induced protein Ves